MNVHLTDLVIYAYEVMGVIVTLDLSRCTMVLSLVRIGPVTLEIEL